jgi:hypothetical protein
MTCRARIEREENVKRVANAASTASKCNTRSVLAQPIHEVLRVTIQQPAMTHKIWCKGTRTVAGYNS